MKRRNNKSLKKTLTPHDLRRRILSLLIKAEDLFASDLEQSSSLCLRAVAESKASKNKELIAGCLSIAGKCFIIRTELKRAERFSSQARKIYKSIGDLDGMLDAWHYEISAKLFVANEKEHLIRLHEILSQRLNTPLSDAKPQNEELFFIPRTWQDRIKNIFPPPEEAEKAHLLHLGELYGTLWRAYMMLHDKKALSYLEEMLAVARRLKNHGMMAMALNNLGSSYTLVGFRNNALAMEYLLQGLKEYRGLGHKRGEASATMNLARVYLQSGQVNKGKQLARKALHGFSELGMWDALARSLVSLATHERLHGNPGKAKEYNANALEVLSGHEENALYLYAIFQQILIEHLLAPSRAIYDKLVDLYAEIKKRKIEMQKDAAIDIASIAQELRLHREAVRWLKIVHEDEIERIKNEQKNIITSLSTQQELEHLASERELQKLKMANLELELKAKARENELMAIQIAKKGSFLATLTEQLRAMKSGSERYSPETINAVVDLINSVRFKDKEYESLEEHAIAMHKDFMIILSDRFPSLTATEKRICILMKLGLKPNDIASVLFISARTVETHSLNIRKKLHLSGKIRLLQYLQALS